MTKTPASLEKLLADLIDYAGLFPPAKLDMNPAVEEYARQRQSDRRWMLARFILPLGRLDEFIDAAADHFDGNPWPLSVLVAGDATEARRTIDAFNEAHRGRAAIEAVETRRDSPADIVTAGEALGGLSVFYELPHREPDLGPWMDAVAQAGGAAKIRSGGVTAEAFPSSEDVARFIAAAVDAGVPFKATAGLHHPLRGDYRLTYEPDSPTGTMHGFLNVFLTAAGLRSGILDQAKAAELLEERSTDVTVEGDGLRWGDHHFSTAQLDDARRHFALSYGSCSFAEPVEDLETLGILT